MQYKLMLHNNTIWPATDEELGRIKTYGTIAEAATAQLDRATAEVEEARRALELKMAALARLTAANHE